MPLQQASTSTCARRWARGRDAGRFRARLTGPLTLPRNDPYMLLQFAPGPNSRTSDTDAAPDCRSATGYARKAPVEREVRQCLHEVRIRLCVAVCSSNVWRKAQHAALRKELKRSLVCCFQIRLPSSRPCTITLPWTPVRPHRPRGKKLLRLMRS